MKILFVYPDINIRGGALSYHYGLGSLSAVLKNAGHETDLQYIYGTYDAGPLISKIEKYKPDVVGITTVSFQYKYIKRLLKDISHFKIFTICGGPHISLMPDELRNTEHLDAVCVGEGEYALLELVNALENGTDITSIKNIWVKKIIKFMLIPAGLL